MSKMSQAEIEARFEALAQERYMGNDYGDYDDEDSIFPTFKTNKTNQKQTDEKHQQEDDDIEALELEVEIEERKQRISDNKQQVTKLEKLISIAKKRGMANAKIGDLSTKMNKLLQEIASDEDFVASNSQNDANKNKIKLLKKQLEDYNEECASIMQKIESVTAELHKLDPTFKDVGKYTNDPDTLFNQNNDAEEDDLFAHVEARRRQCMENGDYQGGSAPVAQQSKNKKNVQYISF